MRAKLAFLLIALTAAIIVSIRSPERAAAQDIQTPGVWVDPSTNLMWAAKDNGKDVSWRKAMKYCRDLRLAGYMDWRLANMAELQGIYDEKVESPGLAGMHDDDPFTWHVKGNLFLTGLEWGGRQVRGRMPIESYEHYFDFNEGRTDEEPSGFPYSSSFMRALCVRGSEK